MSLLRVRDIHRDRKVAKLLSKITRIKLLYDWKLVSILYFRCISFLDALFYHRDITLSQRLVYYSYQAVLSLKVKFNLQRGS